METHLRPIEKLSFPVPANDGRSHFDTYCTERVSLTSTLFGGGDWRWRLISSTGDVLVDCGGYRNQADCLAAVELLRSEAGNAILRPCTS